MYGNDDAQAKADTKMTAGRDVFWQVRPERMRLLRHARWARWAPWLPPPAGRRGRRARSRRAALAPVPPSPQRPPACPALHPLAAPQPLLAFLPSCRPRAGCDPAAEGRGGGGVDGLRGHAVLREGWLGLAGAGLAWAGLGWAGLGWAGCDLAWLAVSGRWRRVLLLSEDHRPSLALPTCYFPTHPTSPQLYTSGSTGKPKGVLHTTGGFMVSGPRCCLKSCRARWPAPTWRPRHRPAAALSPPAAAAAAAA